MSAPVATTPGELEFPLNIGKDEVNYLVFRFLRESGFQHSAFTFFMESHLGNTRINEANVPNGALYGILQNFVAGRLGVFAPPQKPRAGTSSAPLNIALEKRRSSVEFQKKQFMLREERRQRWRKLANQRRQERKTLELIKEFRQGLNMSFLFRKTPAAPRKRKTPSECPLDTCPRKRRVYKFQKITKVSDAGRLEGIARVPSDSSAITHISKASGRIRSPLRLST